MRKLLKAPLKLQRETIRNLNDDALRAAVGGKHITAQSGQPECQSVDECPTPTCPVTGVRCPPPISTYTIVA